MADAPAPLATEGRAVRPQECVLAVGIPLTLEELTEAASRADSEFVRLVYQAYGGEVPADAWHRGYSALSEHVCRVMQDVRDLGVTVIDRSGIADLPALFAKFRVVSLLAHGPFPLLTPEDVRGPQSLLNALGSPAGNGGSHPLVAKLRGRVPSTTSLNRIVRDLRRMLETGEKFFHWEPPSSGKACPEEYERLKPNQGITRMTLEEAFPECFRSPPVIELRDGHHSFEAFVNTVPESFDGTIDFIVCSALWFAEPLRRVRPRLEDITCPKQLAYLGSRTHIYRWAIKLLADQPMKYADALWMIHRWLMDAQNEARGVGRVIKTTEEGTDEG